MAKKRKRAAKADPQVVRTAAKGVAAVALGAGLIVAVGWIGRRAGEGVADRERYAVPLSRLRFDTPPYIDPKAFLTETRYLGDLPDTVQATDPELAAKLSAAFRKHPWVADVGAVAVAADGAVRVGIRFRVPALAVRWVSGSEREVRAVDAGGVLLPVEAPTDGLPVLVNDQTGPKPDPGQVWPGPDVRRAAELVSRHPARAIERTKAGWKITEPGGAVFGLTAP
jgi:hypothetical protein